MTLVNPTYNLTYNLGAPPCSGATQAFAQRYFSNHDHKYIGQGFSATHSVAASVVGKFGFLCSTLFAKVGRLCTGYLRECQYSQNSSFKLSPQLRLSLQLMKHIVAIAPRRSCNFGPPRRPCILYTDASDVRQRDPRYGIGGVFIQQNPTFRIEFFSAEVPTSTVEQWIPKQLWANLKSWQFQWPLTPGDTT